MKHEDNFCDTCEWFDMAASKTHGYCKRFPPVFTRNDERGFARFYNPVTGLNNWCGEWKAVEE